MISAHPMQQINNSKPPENKSLALHFECEAILSIKTKVDNIGGTIKVGVITQWYYGINTQAEEVAYEINVLKQKRHWFAC